VDNKPLLLLTEDVVWEVLVLADRFQVLAVVHDCFHFLLHHHRHRCRSRHLCSVLETAHQLNHPQQHAECLTLAKQRAARIFKNAAALSELCHSCMKELVSADDLDLGCPAAMTEGLVQEAVMMWARGACAKRGVLKPGLEDLRSEAGEMVFDVRYACLPSAARSRLLLDKRGRAALSSLLTQDEVNCLLKASPDRLTSRANRHRHRLSNLSVSDDGASKHCCSFLCSKVRTKTFLKSTLQCVCLFVFLFSVIYIPVAVLKNLSQDLPQKTHSVAVKENTTTTTTTTTTTVFHSVTAISTTETFTASDHDNLGVTLHTASNHLSESTITVSLNHESLP
jgi:hypothetical protein